MNRHTSIWKLACGTKQAKSPGEKKTAAPAGLCSPYMLQRTDIKDISI